MSYILYGSDTMTLRMKEEVRLDIFERKDLRRIYGPYLDPRTRKWKIRINEAL